MEEERIRGAKPRRRASAAAAFRARMLLPTTLFRTFAKAGSSSFGVSPGASNPPAAPSCRYRSTGSGTGGPDAVLTQDSQAVFEAGGIGNGGSRGDAAQVVPDHVGEEQGNDLGAVGVPQQAASLETAQVLPDRVDLVDGGARVQEDRGGRLLVRQRDSRDGAGGQGRAAPREEHQEEVRGRQVPVQEFQDPRRCGNAVLIRFGMSGLQHPGLVQDTAVLVLDHHQTPAQTVSQDLLDGGRHGNGRLPGSGQKDLAEVPQRVGPVSRAKHFVVQRQRVPNRLARVHRRQSRTVDKLQDPHELAWISGGHLFPNPVRYGLSPRSGGGAALDRFSRMASFLAAHSG